MEAEYLLLSKQGRGGVVSSGSRHLSATVCRSQNKTRRNVENGFLTRSSRMTLMEAEYLLLSREGMGEVVSSGRGHLSATVCRSQNKTRKRIANGFVTRS